MQLTKGTQLIVDGSKWFAKPFYLSPGYGYWYNKWNADDVN